MKYSEDYFKLQQNEYTTIRRYKKGKVGEIVSETYPSGSHYAKIIKVEKKTLDELDEMFLYHDTGYSEREGSYKIIQSFYRKPIDFKNEKFYIYYLKKVDLPFDPPKIEVIEAK